MAIRRSALRAALAVALALGLPRAAGARFVTFESGQVRPLALAPDGSRLFAVNTPDARLEIFDVTSAGLVHAASVAVGMEPVAVAARTNDEIWVVNHLSDSVSIVRLDPSPPRVARTLFVGDEPRDVVFAGAGGARAFVTAARRGQHRPGDAQLATPGVGRADVWVFDAADPGAGPGGTPLDVVTLFGDTPGALAATADGSGVYVAVFQSGNGTTTIPEPVVCNGGPDVPPCSIGGVPAPGGLPGPRVNVDGVPAPETGLIVRFDADAGEWRDPLGRSWNDAVRFELPDLDVFRIDAASLAVTAEYAHVGTTLFGMVVNPVTGDLYVTNTEARNDVRFEGPGVTGGSTVRGRLHESRITIVRDGAVLPRHLNPHIDYGVVPSPPGVRERSLAIPLGVAVSGDGATIWMTAFGSGVVTAIDAAALEAGTYAPDAADHVAVGGGPSGVVLDEVRGRLYVLTRFDDAVSVVDLATRREIAEHPLYNPEPPSVVAGRPLLYDARATSSNGEAACASCHVFGDLDGLAWDLGNPDGAVVPNPNPLHIGDPVPFHPMKGPMTTQTLRGMASHGPMHWRGDRTGGSRAGGDPLAEDQAFFEFNVAFESLLGRDGAIADDDMRRFGAFVLQVTPPPNPIRALDGSLTPEQQAGRELYFGRVTDDDDDCVGCHALQPRNALFGADGQTALQGLRPQLFKIPHLRNLYQKVGMFAGDGASSGPQVRGFGFTHDGSTDTVFRFLGESQFTLSPSERRQLEQFLFAYDGDLAPVVGQQVTLGPGTTDAANPRIDLFVAQDDANECELIVRGVVGGEDRGWLRLPGGLFASDRVADAPLDDGSLRALAAAPGQELTYTCVPLGSGPRMALDRDEDGALDHDEVDAGTDPADRASAPGVAVSLERTLVRTSALRLQERDAGARVSFVARTRKDDDANRIVPPPRDSGLDLARHGATLYVWNAAFTSDLAIIPLPPDGWRHAGSTKKPKGYRYRGRGPDTGVRGVILAPDVLRVRGDVPYTLNEPAQGRVAVALVPGVFSGSGWCAAAPARRSGPQSSTAKSDRVGRFTAQPNAAPPEACPAFP